MFLQKRKGYTLLEVLLAVTILSILIALTITFLRPARQLGRARNADRQTSLQRIDEALTRYVADNGQLPPSIVNATAEIEICAQIATPSDCTSESLLDLEPILVPGYLEEIPQDPNLSENGTGFFLAYVEGDIYLRAAETERLNEDISIGQPPSLVSSCPPGYILVPGNDEFNTNDFCVMKYEAKDSGDGQTATSVAGGVPWVNIPYIRVDAGITTPTACQNAGAELINNSEWMTIARNIEQVDVNWTGASVGTEMLYRGHSEETPAALLAADTNDANGLFGITGTRSDLSTSQDYRSRTMELSNGNVIWDFAGNAREGIASLVDGVNKPAGNELNWVDWNSVVNFGSYLPKDFLPSDSSWNALDNGVGAYFEGETIADREYYIYRGGYWSDYERSGIYYAAMDYQTINFGDTVGFRCVIR